MIGVYSRGADVDFARTQARPSVSKGYRAGGPPKEPNRRAKSDFDQQQESLAALVNYVQGDPALRKALLQALIGAA